MGLLSLGRKRTGEDNVLDREYQKFIDVKFLRFFLLGRPFVDFGKGAFGSHDLRMLLRGFYLFFQRLDLFSPLKTFRLRRSFLVRILAATAQTFTRAMCCSRNDLPSLRRCQATMVGHYL